MSSQRGNVKKGAPKHQNTFAFKHNNKSKKTAKILSSPVEGLCKRCHDIIQWRKQYRKYKPLTKPATCKNCHQKTVTAAYHVYCSSCAKEKKVCAKCLESKDIIQSERETEELKLAEEKELELAMEGMKERERRRILRKLQAGELEDQEVDDEDDEQDKEPEPTVRRAVVIDRAEDHDGEESEDDDGLVIDDESDDQQEEQH